MILSPISIRKTLPYTGGILKLHPKITPIFNNKGHISKKNKIQSPKKEKEESLR